MRASGSSSTTSTVGTRPPTFAPALFMDRQRELPFQPVLIGVELDGKKYQELHVDGGAIAQLFLYPPTVDLGRSGVRRLVGLSYGR